MRLALLFVFMMVTPVQAQELRELTERTLRAQVLAERSDEAYTRPRDRRAKYVLALGTGMIAGGLFHGLFFSQRHICGDRTRGRYDSAPITGGIVAGLGAAMLTTGGVLLARNPRYTLKRGQRIAAAGIALGTAAVSMFLQTLTLIPETDGFCIENS